jgi:hypothetical protein
LRTTAEHRSGVLWNFDAAMVPYYPCTISIGGEPPGRTIG